jgi:hypothetical protein
VGECVLRGDGLLNLEVDFLLFDQHLLGVRHEDPPTRPRGSWLRPYGHSTPSKDHLVTASAAAATRSTGHLSYTILLAFTAQPLDAAAEPMALALG